jgi:hypothetical protein
MFNGKVYEGVTVLGKEYLILEGRVCGYRLKSMSRERGDLPRRGI